MFIVPPSRQKGDFMSEKKFPERSEGVQGVTPGS